MKKDDRSYLQVCAECLRLPGCISYSLQFCVAKILLNNLEDQKKFAEQHLEDLFLRRMLLSHRENCGKYLSLIHVCVP